MTPKTLFLLAQTAGVNTEGRNIKNLTQEMEAQIVDWLKKAGKPQDQEALTQLQSQLDTSLANEQALRLQLEEASTQATLLKETHDASLAKLTTDSTQQLLDYAIDTSLASKPLASANGDTASQLKATRQLIDAELAAQNLSVRLDDTSQLTLVSLDGESKPYQPFLDTLLSSRGLLAVSRLPNPNTSINFPAILQPSAGTHSAVQEIDRILNSMVS